MSDSMRAFVYWLASVAVILATLAAVEYHQHHHPPKETRHRFWQRLSDRR